MQIYYRLVNSLFPFSTKVYVAEVLPKAKSFFPGKKSSASFLRQVNPTALDVNRRLLQLQVDCEWVRIVTFPEFMKSGSPNRSMLSKDGLHLSPQGSRLVATRLEHHFKNILTARIAERVDDDAHSAPVGPLLFSQVLSLCPAVTIRTVDLAVDTDIISSTFDSVPNLVLSTDRAQCKSQKQPTRIVKKERPQKTRPTCAQRTKSPDTNIKDINRYAVLPVQRCKRLLIEGSQKKRRLRTATQSSPVTTTPTHNKNYFIDSISNSTASKIPAYTNNYLTDSISSNNNSYLIDSIRIKTAANDPAYNNNYLIDPISNKTVSNDPAYNNVGCFPVLSDWWCS